MANATRIVDKASGIYVGKYTGSAAALPVNIGFKPSYIHAQNLTTGLTTWEWFSDDVAQVFVTTGTVATEAVAVTQVDDGTTLGFNIPINAVINAAGEVYRFWAVPA